MKLILFFTFFLSALSLATSEWPKISIGLIHSCAVSEAGRVKCWGENGAGQLGLGDTENRGENWGQMGENLPDVDLGTGLKAIEVGAGGYHSCALFDNGRIKCWGGNYNGRLGLGDEKDRGARPNQMGDRLPFLDLGTGTKAISIQVGEHHSCALLENGQVKCWGANISGQLGLGDSNSRGKNANEMGDHLPVVDLGKNYKAIAIKAASYHSCALLEDGGVKCWGSNNDGELGLGNTENRGNDPGEMGEKLPLVDFGVKVKVVQISAAGRHSCVLFENGKIKCWGYNEYGQLGLGDTRNRGDKLGTMGIYLPHPDIDSTKKILQIVTGESYSCAQFAQGLTKCWGGNSNGKLGLEDAINRGNHPNQMGAQLPFLSLGVPVRTLVAGSNHSCAVLLNNGIKCWGFNGYGNLGLENKETLGDMPGEMGNDLPYVDLGMEFQVTS